MAPHPSPRRLPRAFARPLRILVAAAAPWGIAACGDDGPSGPDGSDTSVRIDTPVEAPVVAGDTVELSATSAAGAVTWVSRSPRVAAVEPSGRVWALRPGRTWIVARSGDAADSVGVTVIPRAGGYSAAEVDYFAEVALGYEFGGASEVVRRWGSDIRFTVLGSPTTADRATLDDVVADLNALTVLHDLVEDPVAPAVEIHFVPLDRFSEIVSNVVPGNVGYFAVWWNGRQELIRSVVLLATDISQELRHHLIREEVTQMLGLGRDSSLYPESIFYQQFSLTDRYAPIDEALVEMLYRPEVRVGMDEEEVGRVLRRLTRVSAGAPTPGSISLPAPRPASTGRPGRGSGGQAGPPPGTR